MNRLDALEKESVDSTLVIYEPGTADKAFFRELCELYMRSPEHDKLRIRDAVHARPGVMNNLLGYLYVCVHTLTDSRNPEWLRIGLAAASIRGDGPDFRDFYLALADLYLAALDADINAGEVFNRAGGGVPRSFEDSAIIKSKLAEWRASSK
jgi:hypothetical protein